MPLPSSGAISIAQIRTELGTSDGSLRNLSSIAGKGTPDAMSEFYGYSASTTNAVVVVYNSSYDIYITSIAVNGIPVSGFSTVAPGTAEYFFTNQSGSSNTVSISYSSSLSGQGIYFTDGLYNQTCTTINGGGGSFSIFGAAIFADGAIYIDAYDLSC